MPAPWVALIVSLWAVVIILVVLVLGLIRRIEELQLRPLPGAGPRPALTGRTLGLPLPVFEDYEQLADAPFEGSPRVVLFLSSSCGMCVKLARDLRTRYAELAEQACFEEVRLLLVTDPDWSEPVADVASLVVADTDGGLRESWRIPGTPYAVVIGDDGAIRGASFIDNVDGLRDIAVMVQTGNSV